MDARDTIATPSPDPIAADLAALGRELAGARVARSMRQEDVAAAAGLPTHRVSHVENMASDVRLSTVFKVARAVGVRIRVERDAA